MISQERQKEATQKIRDLIVWYKTADLNVGIIQLYPGSRIVNVKQFVETNISRLESFNLYSTVLRVSYIHLMDLKEILTK